MQVEPTSAPIIQWSDRSIATLSIIRLLFARKQGHKSLIIRWIGNDMQQFTGGVVNRPEGKAFTGGLVGRVFARLPSRRPKIISLDGSLL
jgi:hypothetical protein